MGSVCCRPDAAVDVLRSDREREKDNQHDDDHDDHAERRHSCHSVSEDSARLHDLLHTGNGHHNGQHHHGKGVGGVVNPAFKDEEGVKAKEVNGEVKAREEEEEVGDLSEGEKRDTVKDAATSAEQHPASEGNPLKATTKRGSGFSRTAVKGHSMSSKPPAQGGAPTNPPGADDEHTHPTLSKVAPQRAASAAPKDLMISYSHADKDMMLRVREKLEQNGISVWVDVSGLQAGVDFLSKIGEAIIDAKLFISLLSINCVKSRYCQDELALAYVSDTSIFPVAIQDPSTFKSQMDTGMKLQLARYDWTQLDENNFDEKFLALVDQLKAELKRITKEREDEEKKTPDTGGIERSKSTIERAKSRARLNKAREGQMNSVTSTNKVVMPDTFWKDNFKNADVIDGKQFEDVLFKTFAKEIEELFSEVDHDWLKAILRREMEVEEDDKLYKFNFDAFFQTEGTPQAVWERVLSQAMESSAMKDVFNMESSVRVEAIENLGKFRSAAVIDALRDLLSDGDANVRAVASVSLARTEASDPVTLKFLAKTLNDKDRLVREAGCLALGHLRAKQSVAKLLHLWRNDVISHVREAARVALEQIGGPEVEKAMHVTKVLADEIRQLTTQH